METASIERSENQLIFIFFCLNNLTDWNGMQQSKVFLGTKGHTAS